MDTNEGKTNLQELQSLQDSFALCSHIYMSCYGTSYRKMTDFSGSADEEAFFRRYIPVETEKVIISSFMDGDVENVIEGDAYQDFVHITGIAIRDDSGKVLGVFLLYGLIADLVGEEDMVPAGMRTLLEVDYQNAVAFLEQTLRHYFHQRFRTSFLEDRIEEIQSTEKRLEDQLRKNEVLTDTLKMMESENDFVKVAEDILRDTGSYLKVSNAFLLRVQPDEKGVEMVCEWCQRPSDSLIHHFEGMPLSKLPFFTDRPYTISTESVMPEEFSEFFANYDITAGVFLPLSLGDQIGMYLCYVMTKMPRRWSVTELRFIDDIKRVMQTILVKRVTKNSLAGSYAALDAILENTGCGICVYELSTGKQLYSNGTYRKMFDNAIDAAEMDKALTSAGDKDKIEYFTSFSKRYYSISLAKIRWVDGRQVRMCTLNDITESKEYQRKIEEQASRDYLTGLYNRMRFEEDFSAQIRDAVRSGDSGSLLYIDLDDFRDINDGLGHQLGDLLLKEAAESLTSILRERGTCYRIGGDEYAVLIPARHQDKLNTIAATIQKRFEQSWDLEGNEYYCTMCMGIVSFPKDGVREDLLMQRVDLALCMAKQRGKSMVEYYSSSDPVSPVRRLDMEKAMREAVDNGCREFEVYYQPLVDVTKEDCPCCGAEALVRWNSSKLGFVMPGDFIPLAEYLGLIVPIGEHVLITACKRCKFWNDFGHPEFKVHVNLSVIQLLQNNIIDTVRNALSFTGIDPANLTLEVTESLAINDMDKMSSVLGDLRKLGVRLALDDFGTGYSSLNRLKEMPLDVIKIDKSFINGIGENDFSDAFVDTVSQLADSIDVNVVVEGVEREQQAKALSDKKIDMIQGYYFDQPLSQEDFEAKYLD